MQHVAHEATPTIQQSPVEANEFGPFEGGAQISGKFQYTLEVELKEKFGRCVIGWDFPLPITQNGLFKFPYSGVRLALYEGKAGESSPVSSSLITTATGSFDTGKNWGSGYSAAILQMDMYRKEWILVSTDLTS